MRQPGADSAPTPTARVDALVRHALVTLHNNDGTPRTTKLAPFDIVQVHCSKCGCCNVDKAPHARTEALVKYGCGVTKAPSCKGCRCHTEPRPWVRKWKAPAGLPQLIVTRL